MKYGMKVAVLAATACGFGLANTGMAYEPGDWLLRAGAMIVDPKTQNHEVVSVDDGSSATFALTYMMTDIWAIELLAAAPFKHDLELVGGSAIGSTKHLPPTLTLQYRFRPTEKFQPYIGLGVNYTTFSSQKTEGPLAGTTLDLDDSWGVAGQIGFDYLFSDKVFLNLDVRWANIETDVTIDGVNLGTFIENAFEIYYISDTVKIDPWIYGMHLGFRF